MNNPMDQQQLFKAEEELDAYITELLLLSGVPSRHVGNFSRYCGTTATRDGIKCPKQGFLVFSGKPGTGKSFGAAWLIKTHRSQVDETCKREQWKKAKTTAINTLWYSAYDIADNKNVASKAKTFALVVIDDLGKEGDSGYALAAVRNVISKRYDSALPTVITTELILADIRNRYGRGVAEKLVEDIAHEANLSIAAMIPSGCWINVTV